MASPSLPTSLPEVSIVWYGKNRFQWVEREIETLLRQSHVNWELVVEDGGSTDGTLEYFQKLAAQDGRVSVASTATHTGGDLLLRALRRCAGKYIAISPRHASLAHDALEFAVGMLDPSPEIGALACHGLLVDAEGDPAAVAFDLVMALFTPLRISLSGGVIRRSALMESGLERDDWRTSALAFDLWCRLAIDHDIATTDRAISNGKVARDDGDFEIDPKRAVEDRLGVVGAVFAGDSFFGGAGLALKYECLAHQLGILREEIGGTPLVERHSRRLAMGFVHLANYDARAFRAYRRWHRMWRMSDRLEELVGRWVPAEEGQGPLVSGPLRFLARQLWPAFAPTATAGLRARARKLDERAISRLPVLFADLYASLAERYNAHGQVEMALRNLRLAEPLGDAMVDSIAVQTELKRPGATEASLAEAHRRWVARHLGEVAEIPSGDLPRWDGRRKIRVGYHCAFMNNDTTRYMMAKVLQAHDRDGFEIYGYSPFAVPPVIAQGFDVVRDTSSTVDDVEAVYFHNTPMISHAAFRQMVRDDCIDVLVELTGFSPGHRFPAMAARCAPVQVSFLNHTASSQVPNVDYILADETCLPEGGGFEAHYSEQIYRLPGCFFCFDYRGSDYPPLSKPPSLANGYITFGCFGFGGKLNFQLLRLWAELLRQIPSARLYLQNSQIKNERSRRFLVERFRSFGIPPERLILAVGSDRRSLLDVYAKIDISLDTWPYCGGNTIAEALWHGVPVITLKGDRFSSRYGASLVAAAGCSHLVAESPEQYIAVAKQLAENPQHLADLRERLRDMSIEYGLGDSALFARRLEEAYVDMLSHVGNDRRDQAGGMGHSRSRQVSHSMLDAEPRL